MRQRTASAGDRSGSSGYGGSSDGNGPEQIYSDRLKLVEETGTVVEQNPTFVKSIKVAGQGVGVAPAKASSASIPNSSSSSGGGTLSTIPEGRVDLPVPQPIWPMDRRYDSLVDDALLLYTSLNYVPEIKSTRPDARRSLDLSVKDLLVDLLASINRTLDGKMGSPEDMLRTINEEITLKLDALRNTTEEEMRRLCVNLSNSKRVSSVMRAFSQSSSSGRSSSSCRDDDIYRVPSNSSSSGFSDSPTLNRRPSDALLPAAPVFLHDDVAGLSRGMRNALIYGTLCRHKLTKESRTIGDSVFLKDFKCDKQVVVPVEKNAVGTSLVADAEDKPSVWALYYGMRAEGAEQYLTGKPTDVPIYPGGRPEADFTLDLPRSELLSKRMKADKKWRCRCRLLTSFLGFVFFLLSVMAVSLILTRGRRMFGSMV
ncbi:uncharacterized protein LOC132708140 isoform X2 [Cylas formicarius]|nr:uncharacterized protein LOC132708140 isoform X2 [Cylas formicarius]